MENQRQLRIVSFDPSMKKRGVYARGTTKYGRSWMLAEDGELHSSSDVERFLKLAKP
jgi:hypothetical protein